MPYPNQPAPNDTRAAAEGQDRGPKKLSARFWLGEIAASEKREAKWRKMGNKIVDRYRDERDSASAAERHTNVLWSNTETLKGVMFQGLGQPDVRRRFPRKKDVKAGKTAALCLENSLSYCSDAYDANGMLECAIEDMLLPGRGMCWVVYDADVRDKPGEAKPSGGDYVEPEAEPPQEIVDQSVYFDHVYWEDYRQSAGRKDADVWWKARKHLYSRDELRKYFEDHAAEIPLGSTLVDGYTGREKKVDIDEDTYKRACVWEIWDKSKRERVYIAEGYQYVLKKDDDPYALRDFFPAPEPLYGVKTTQSANPIPEYTLYQDQAEELDKITTRLRYLVDALKRRGVYDSSMEGPDNQLSQLADADDNEFLPFKGFAQLQEKGGLKAVFQTEDLAPTIAVVQALYAERQNLIQTIYEITGISDVVRGSSDPDETATAQRLKGQFGSLRLNSRKSRVQKFIRNLYRIKAEIIAEHFTREKIQEMSGIELPLATEISAAQSQLAMLEKQSAQPEQLALPPPQAARGGANLGGMLPPQDPAAPQLPQEPEEAQGEATPMQGQVPMQSPPMMGAMPQGIPIPLQQPDPDQVEQLQCVAKAQPWEKVEEILRNDDKRGYVIDIETDATMMADEQAEKESRMEFVTTIGAMMEKSIPAAMQVPELVPIIRETTMFTIKAFKVGRTLEESFEETFEKLEMKAQQNAAQGPPPDPKAEAEKAKAEAVVAQTQQDMQMATQKHQRETEVMRIEQQQASERHQADMDLRRSDAIIKEALLQLKKADLARAAQQMDLDYIGGSIKLQHDTDKGEREAQSHAVALNGKVAEQAHREQDAELKRTQAPSVAKSGNGLLGSAIAAPKSGLQQSLQQMDSGLQTALAQMAQAMSALAQTNTALLQNNALVLQAITAPKELIRDQNGRATGVRTAADFDTVGNA